MQRALLAVLIAAGFPFGAQASVVISEVAWMGSADNANAEWIELYNNGPEQDVTGWMLSAADGSPEVQLSGVLAAGAYAVLERTSDAAAPGVTAYVVYTGALSNAGEKLVLTDSAGERIDEVNGTDEWAIGGDNETKETLQRAGDPPVGAWVTAPPTPGAGLLGSTLDTTSDTSRDTRKTSTSILYGSEGSDEALPHLEPALTVVVPAERTVARGVATNFSAALFQERGREIVSAQVSWNFGDGTVADGLSVEHAYKYPGRYVVSVEAHRKNFIEDIHDRASMVVTVVEPEVVLSAVTAAYVELQNTGSTPLDLSGFVLRVGKELFTLPQGTFILEHEAVRFPAETTALVYRPGTSVALLHPEGTLAVLYAPAVTAIAAGQRQASVSMSHEEERVTSAPHEGSATAADVATAPYALPLDSTALLAASDVLREGARTETKELWWWLLALGAAILAVLVTMVLIRHEEPVYIEGFEIESDE